MSFLHSLTFCHWIGFYCPSDFHHLLRIFHLFLSSEYEHGNILSLPVCREITWSGYPSFWQKGQPLYGTRSLSSSGPSSPVSSVYYRILARDQGKHYLLPCLLWGAMEMRILRNLLPYFPVPSLFLKQSRTYVLSLVFYADRLLLGYVL